MRKVIIAFILTVVVGFLTFKNIRMQPSSQNPFPKPTQAIKSINTQIPQKPTTTLFIPYWTFGNRQIIDDTYDELVYFGIEANATGIDTTESGYKNIAKFIKNTNRSKKRLLTVRMINTAVDTKILNNSSATDAVITQSVSMATDNRFDGIVLDLEISALSFDSVIKSISSFEKKFNKQAQNNNLSFDVMMYGDNYYRARPYDVKTIAANANKIFIMAYDFTKTGGLDPGPNFPLYGKDIFGYDFTEMIDDFTKQVSVDKLSIVYGMFGYNWNVDGSNKSQGQAQSLTLNQINALFYPHCYQTACVVKTDTQSSETIITYQDKDGQKHTVWFESTDSSAAKQNYAKQKGIMSQGYWAYSYF